MKQLLTSRASTILSVGLNAMGLLILAGIIIVSVRRPNIPWDSWAYHLPFSAKLLNINNVNSFFILDKEMLDRFDGFPLFLDLMRGLFWRLTGDVRASALLSSVSFAFFSISISYFFKFNLLIFVVGLLAVPQISIHVFSTYSDLPFGILVASQFICAVSIERYCFQECYKDRTFIILGGFFVALGFFVGNSKMWGPILSTLIGIFLVLFVLLKYWSKLKQRVVKIIGLTILMIFLSNSTLIKNAVVYENPFWPITFTMPFTKHVFIGPEAEHLASPGYGNNLKQLERPYYFFTSVSEIDWLIRGVDSYYSLDSAPGESPREYGKARTGGWWGPYIIFNLLLLTFLYVNQKYKYKYKFPIYLFIFITISVSMLPQSHELRYHLFWPLVLIFLTNYLGCFSSFKLIIDTTYVCAFLISLFILRGEDLRDESISNWFLKRKWDQIVFPLYVPEIQKAIQLGGICLGREFYPNQFKYSAIFNGKDYVIEQAITDCKYYKNYKYVKDSLE